MGVSEFHWQRELMIKASCQDRRTALQAIASDVSDRTGIETRAILEPLIEREALGSTGFGGGFALPHALIPKLRFPAKLLMTLRQGIEFDAPDDTPVDILLAVLWPQDQQEGFLPALARMCRMFRSSHVLQGLRSAGTKTEAMMVLQPFSHGLVDANHPANPPPMRYAARRP
ncbi:PTS sugar transporter subunit IIA [Sinorhizobium americanum]|uniref:PTS system nitrogen regulatory IIA component n=1 Tax=Sinorhizobium americanum TaxID=194963 RepID=A0A4R2B4W1_9HYPH|nr:PTS sugar transporter subunit IIA [Sinorhizobium americanum]TCN21273.1 PTS system nitrogen regulatory IIA component [Sinorhizobium americanum]